MAIGKMAVIPVDYSYMHVFKCQIARRNERPYAYSFNKMSDLLT